MTVPADPPSPLTAEALRNLIREYRSERNPGRVLALWAAIDAALADSDARLGQWHQMYLHENERANDADPPSLRAAATRALEALESAPLSTLGHGVEARRALRAALASSPAPAFDPRQPHGESGLFQHEPGAPCVVCDRSSPAPAGLDEEHCCNDPSHMSAEYLAATRPAEDER